MLEGASKLGRHPRCVGAISFIVFWDLRVFVDPFNQGKGLAWVDRENCVESLGEVPDSQDLQSFLCDLLVGIFVLEGRVDFYEPFLASVEYSNRRGRRKCGTASCLLRGLLTDLFVG